MNINQTKLSLRKATSADIETLIEHRIIFLKEVHCNPSPELEATVRKSLRQYLAGAFKNDTFVSWIAEYENKPVGFSGIVFREQPGNFELPAGRTGYILNMFTIREFRGNGIGSSLFQKLLEESRLRGLDKVELHATKDGEPVYRKFKFTEPHDIALEIIFK
jgi:ribosomal protein S18 acetylase RimI-like enzyme